MKKITCLKKVLMSALMATSAFLIAPSCNDYPKTTDSKDAAEGINEKNFDAENRKRDAQFLVDAAEINLEEVMLGQLAQVKSKMNDIKELGKMIEEGHSGYLNDLKILAEKKTISIPVAQTDNGNDAYTKLNSKSGTDFDKEYCDRMVTGHKDAIELFEKASAVSSDADIKQWATSALPGLRIHLDHAITTRNKLKN